ncbi:hypothetical protein EMIHUDRAFT_240190 [Emiliania huxleyi CCMP1516]|uniref:Uncharacterized protein n=2 Tax=Emiliania huxleyi TaxID=2903 RepID=A0A0D3JG86_EMIH1|nr:hypothetical protein EMIHUDRAFT_240190 [Emiliania huxleyi CCMP1516]EOD22521.1 hypothetical protein EMIHUDRAFT_240190 [Emiliania huxleyi CCMP1516]|eukprot:XP_005774950.1 hypothetical protein EMIHUDRAFT_240190 [Emiliania huxleyi CCMP1516]
MTSSPLGGHDDDGSDGSSSAEFFPCDEYPQDVPGAIAEPVVGCAAEVDQFVVGEARTARAELDRMRAALLRVSTVAVDLAERSLLLAESQSLPPRSRGMEQEARLQLYRRAFGHVDVQRAAESRQAAHLAERAQRRLEALAQLDATERRATRAEARAAELEALRMKEIGGPIPQLRPARCAAPGASRVGGAVTNLSAGPDVFQAQRREQRQTWERARRAEQVAAAERALTIERRGLATLAVTLCFALAANRLGAGGDRLKSARRDSVGDGATSRQATGAENPSAASRVRALLGENTSCVA